ncbi:hypothetical protein [Propioniciclava sinopodophylli]|uniref:hypothetical protein n=1 Tax=Propioniciclava sinopodophylli TaxID=1837344 RepID=UPI0024902245|nr:hypothetical protein [Propioniciclava sinopodophylli]
MVEPEAAGVRITGVHQPDDGHSLIDLVPASRELVVKHRDAARRNEHLVPSVAIVTVDVLYPVPVPVQHQNERVSGLQLPHLMFEQSMDVRSCRVYRVQECDDGLLLKGLGGPKKHLPDGLEIILDAE